MEDVRPPTGRAQISEEAWAQAHANLVFYFSYHGGSNPDDLAQETLTRLLEWLEKGNEIVGENGFQKLCYGFARNVLREIKDRRIPTIEQLDRDLPRTTNTTLGLNTHESAILLDQLLDRMPAKDRELVLLAELLDPRRLAKRFGKSEKYINVRVCRARALLRRLASSEKRLAARP